MQPARCFQEENCPNWRCGVVEAKLKKYKLGKIIGKRSLISFDGSKVAIRIGMPRPYDDNPSFFFCPYEIVGAGIARVSRAGGVDSVHAIQMTFQKIGIDLRVLNRQLEGALRWDAGEDAELGFPLPSGMIDNPNSNREIVPRGNKGLRTKRPTRRSRPRRSDNR